MSSLVTNAQRDPTRTATLRAVYVGAVKKRFNAFKKVVLETVVDNDALALEKGKNSLSFLAMQPAKRYDFPSDPAGKAQAFMDWLYEQSDQGVLEIEHREGRRIVQRSEWQNVYVRSAYAKGVQQADTILKRTGISVPEYELWSILRQPIHADALGMLFVRNFDELKGISEAMGQQIARELAGAMAKGLNPREIGKIIAGRVEHVGVYRGTLLARTEIIRAHAEATLNRYQDFGLQHVGLQAEWQTAGDHRVCPICGALQGQVFTIEEARGMLPRHPQCRCTWLPLLDKGLAGNMRIRFNPIRLNRVQTAFEPGGVYRGFERVVKTKLPV